jgi:uncharacterized protein YndB with AHSA1/START domain
MRKPIEHSSFVIERHFEFPVEKVWRAWTDPSAKAAWFNGGADLVEKIREMDFRVGGRDRFVGKWKSGMTSDFTNTYLDIVRNERIVYTYWMSLNDKLISFSLATVEFIARDGGADLKLTEQGAFVDGFEDKGGREHGTNAIIDKLHAFLRETA